MCNWCKHLKAGRLKICHLFTLQEKVSEYNQEKEELAHRLGTVQKINKFVLDTFHDKELDQVCLHTSSCDDILLLFFLCFRNTRGFCSSPTDNTLGTTPMRHLLNSCREHLHVCRALYVLQFHNVGAMHFQVRSSERAIWSDDYSVCRDPSFSDKRGENPFKENEILCRKRRLGALLWWISVKGIFLLLAALQKPFRSHLAMVLGTLLWITHCRPVQFFYPDC